MAATDQVAKGDFETRTGVPSHRGEVGQLTAAFDRMAEQQRVQLELLEREQHLQLALASARMVTWTWDPARDYIQTTDNFAAIYGLPLSRKQHRGLRWFIAKPGRGIGRW